jgi:phage shock protein A
VPKEDPFVTFERMQRKIEELEADLPLSYRERGPGGEVSDKVKQIEGEIALLKLTLKPLAERVKLVRSP